MMLEVLRGAAAATLPNTFEALLGLYSGLLGPLLTLHHAFKHTAPVVALLLKLADDIVEAMTGYMESPQQKEQLLNWVLQLLAQYRDSNLWQVSTSTNTRMRPPLCRVSRICNSGMDVSRSCMCLAHGCFRQVAQRARLVSHVQLRVLLPCSWLYMPCV